MKSEKIYKIEMTGRRTRVVEGTLEYLKKYFSYTFEIGRSWNRKIKSLPEIKTAKTFVNNLQKCYEEKEANCYNRTYVQLVK